MNIFAGIFFDILALTVILILFTQVLVPLWRGKPLFPSFRKLKTQINKTKDNIKYVR